MRRRRPTTEERLLARKAAKTCGALSNFFCDVAGNETTITERMADWMRDLAELQPFEKSKEEV